MILCKKHLHQKNSDGTYRVGTLIPAPKKPGEAQAYYKVTSWIHNSRGIYSYTLEPACPGTHLPAIKLYRSTSVSSYNLDGASSYKNDFNPINPPGYEGSHLLEPYEKEFFDKRTIPVWVGYQSCADSALTNLAANDLDTASEIRSNLLAANTALTREIEAKYKKPTLKQFIRKYDSEFMELVSACRDSGVIGAYQAWYLLSNSLRNTVKYKYSEHSKEVVYLKNFLEKAAATGQFHSQANELLSWWNWQDKSPTEKEQKMLQTLQAHKDACFDQSLSLDALTASLKTWNSSIHEWAKASKEDLASKTMQNVDFAGHSLGAACAQRFLVNYTAAKGRIPLPGHTIAARLFDDPAINKEDNKAFILFGNKHSKLLQSLKASYTITRRQETGDPVPESGEIHLGATKNEEQQKQMYTWLRFDATLQKPSSKARDPQIRDYTTAHGRLFAGGISRGGWLRGWLSDKISQLQYSNAEVAAQLRENLKSMPIADYKVVHYDSCTQWNFDKPSDLKIWATLRKLWKMPFSFTPIFAERLRTYLSAAFRSGFFHVFLPKFIAQLGQANPPDDVAHGDWQKHCDEKRVFVVPKPQIKANSINPTTISDKLAE